MPKRKARRRPFELQTLRFKRELGGLKEVRPSTTARVDKCGVLQDCLGGAGPMYPNLRKGWFRGASAGGLGTHTRARARVRTHTREIDDR